jgi:hypothetical protein
LYSYVFLLFVFYSIIAHFLRTPKLNRFRRIIMPQDNRNSKLKFYRHAPGGKPGGAPPKLGANEFAEIPVGAGGGGKEYWCDQPGANA